MAGSKKSQYRRFDVDRAQANADSEVVATDATPKKKFRRLNAHPPLRQSGPLRERI